MVTTEYPNINNIFFSFETQQAVHFSQVELKEMNIIQFQKIKLIRKI